MIIPKAKLYKLGLNGLYFSGASHAFRHAFSGIGSLLYLHHVCPPNYRGDFSPNRILDISPEFLESVIIRVKQNGFDVVSIDEFARRMARKDHGRRFVSFTIDDGYRDNFTHAYPIFLRHRVPFCIYLCTGILNETANLWWRDLETVVRNASTIEYRAPGKAVVQLSAATTKQKYSAFNSVYWDIRRMPLRDQIATMKDVLCRHPIDYDRSHDAPLTWKMVEEMVESGLLTVGAHTVNHFALSKLTSTEVQWEMMESSRVIAENTGELPRHFAYPFGDSASAGRREFEISRQVGFTTSVTTRKGVLFPGHAGHMSALPRVSLNGDYQTTRYLDTFLTGLPFAISNGFKRFNVD